MKKLLATRTIVVCTLAVLLVLLAVGIGYAARGVTYDTYVDNAAVIDFPDANYANDSFMYATGSGSSCAGTQAAIVLWDFTGVASGTVQTVTVSFVNHASWNVVPTTVLGLYSVPATWDNNTNNATLVSGNFLGDPATTTYLATATAPTVLGQVVTFIGIGASDPLVQAVQAAVNTKGKVSFGVQPKSGCDQGGVTFNELYQGLTQVTLNALTSNAVTLSTFRAADPTVNWPLIAAALLLVAALAGFSVYRWRVSQVRAR